MLCTATLGISSSSESINSTTRVSRLFLRFLWLWCHQTEITIIIQLMYLLYYTWVTPLPSIFINSTPHHVRLSALSLCEWKLVFCSVLRGVYVGRIYSLIAKDLKFDWSIRSRENEGRLLNQIRFSNHKYSLEQQRESWQILQPLSFLIPVVGRIRYFIFTKQIVIVLFWVIIYSYLQTDALENFEEFTEKNLCRSLFLISQ